MALCCMSPAKDLELMAMFSTSPAGGLEPMTMSHGSLYQQSTLGKSPKVSGGSWKVCTSEMEDLCQQAEGSAPEPGSNAQKELICSFTMDIGPGSNALISLQHRSVNLLVQTLQPPDKTHTGNYTDLQIFNWILQIPSVRIALLHSSTPDSVDCCCKLVL
ncbi:PREDICTED: COMM domain-containing protein 6 isoform X1 [Chinchilla lanigera]|uniref:COMM domain-containing protein 6 isoform X1 n=1 Tax=Chinchilla lanigera TaxID=34839 RepID=UPI000698C0E3|nr:PREDICTED: COMM domain-containing protein 6 isoform X1 [Chinchilla lanigera]